MAFYRSSGSGGGEACVAVIVYSIVALYVPTKKIQLSGGSSHYTIKEADVWSPPVRVAAWRYVNE